MRTLRAQRESVISMEEMLDIEAAIPHVRYIRDLLRFVAATDRARFDEIGWAYGDPSAMGGDLLEIFACQLRSVLHTLFGGWYDSPSCTEALGAEIHALSMIEPDCADKLTGQLVRADGGADGGCEVLPETIQGIKDTPAHPGLETLADRFIAEDARHGAFPQSSPGLGAAHVGLGHLNLLRYQLTSTALSEHEEAILVEFTGAAAHIDRLQRLIQRGAGEAGAPLLYRWRAGSNAARAREERSSLIMFIAENLFDLTFPMTDVVFARLLAAYVQMQP